MSKRYQAFHGHAPRSQGKINFPEPSQLVCLGEAVEIVYRSDKSHGGGDGNISEYVHKFAKGTLLFCDESGKKWLYIHGQKLIVTERGIVN